MTSQLGIKQADYSVLPLETIERPLWWQIQGLSYTASGYGRKLPTRHMVKHDNRWKRVYCCIFSNSGSLFIMSNGQQLSIEVQNND